jgi:predicted ATP-dependent endonuclease of OLD family
MAFIRNLRFGGLYSYPEEIEMELTNNTLLVGPNNSGKSNILRILNLFVDTFTKGKRLAKSETSHKGDDPFLEVKITLSPNEVDKLIDFMSFFPSTQNRSSQYRDLKNREILLKKLDNIVIKLLWQKEVHDYGSQPFMEMYFEKIGLWGGTNYFAGQIPLSNRIISRSGGYPNRTDAFLCDVLGSITNTDHDREVLASLSPKDGAYIILEPVRYGQDVIMDNKGKSTIQNLYSFMKYQMDTNREISFHVFLGMILKRSLCYTSGRISACDIMETAHDLRNYDTQDNFDAKIMTQASMVSLMHNAELASDGSNLSQHLFHLMVSENYEDNEKFEKIRHAFNDILKADELSLDVALEYKPMDRNVNFAGADEKVPKRPMILITDNKLRKRLSLKDVGAGLAEIVYLLSASYGMKNSIVLLDEPSVNLHPPMMKSLMRYLGNDQNQNQFVIITHSAELVQYELFESNASIMYVHKSNQVSKIISLKNGTRTWFNENRSNLKHQIDSRIFFGRCIILTEGESDRNLLGIARFLSSKDPSIDLESNDIIIVSIGGSYNFDKYRKLLDGFHIPYVVLADSDAKRLLPSSGLINKDGISGSENVFVIDEGNLEDFMRLMDLDVYTKTEKEYKGSKPTIAYEFAKKISEKNPDTLKPIKLFLKRAIELSK